jgi:hypothetical protein
LKQKGVYDQIRAILQEAKKDYVPKNPEKRKANLMRELNNLQDEYLAIAADYPKLKEQYPYKAVSYDAAKRAVLDKLISRANAIANELGVQSPFKVKI